MQETTKSQQRQSGYNRKRLLPQSASWKNAEPKQATRPIKQENAEAHRKGPEATRPCQIVPVKSVKSGSKRIQRK